MQEKAQDHNANIAPVRVCVSVLTYKRSKSLGDLLAFLAKQKFFSVRPPDWMVLVVDNDKDQSARSVCESQKGLNEYQLKYVVEEQQGIPFARNRAIREAIENNYDFLCFIDDDEVPENNWLDELLRVQQAYHAECVYGPVHSILPLDTPEWVHKGKFFDRPTFKDGDVLPWAGSGNLMLSCLFLKRSCLRFDVRLRYTGGTDAVFLAQAKRLYGLKIVGAERAIVSEIVSPNRIKLSWILKRKLRVGIDASRCEKYVGEKGFRLGLKGIKGVARIGVGVLILPIGMLAGRYILVKALGMICYGAGVLVGLGPFTYEEYAPSRLEHERNSSSVGS